MTKIELGKDFDISSSEKCSTSEGVYLAIKSGKFDDKLETVLRLTHERQKALLSIETLIDFKKILFGETEVSDEDKTKIRTFLKLTLIGEEKPIINKKFGVLVSEVIDRYIFSNKTVFDLSGEMSSKVTKLLPNLTQENKERLNPLLYGLSDIEFFSYIMSEDNFSEKSLKNEGFNKKIKTIIEKNPKILEYFLTDELSSKKIWNLLELSFNYDGEGDLNYNDINLFEDNIIKILTNISSKSAGNIINNSSSILKNSLIFKYIESSNPIIALGFCRELDFSKDLNLFLNLFKMSSISGEKLIYICSFLFLDGLDTEEKLKNLKLIYDYNFQGISDHKNIIDQIKLFLDLEDIEKYLISLSSKRYFFTPSLSDLL